MESFIPVPYMIQQGVEIPTRIFVGNLPYETKDLELKEFFSRFGCVVDTKVITDRNGVSKGYGFVTFESQEEAQSVLALGSIPFNDTKEINVAKAIRKQGGQYEKANQEYINGQRQVNLVHHYTGDYLVSCINGTWYWELLNNHTQPAKPLYSAIVPTVQSLPYVQPTPALLPTPAGPQVLPYTTHSGHTSYPYPPPPLTYDSQTLTLPHNDPSNCDSGLEDTLSQLSLMPTDSSARLLPHEHPPNPVVHPHVFPPMRRIVRMRGPRFHPPSLRPVAPVTGPHTVASPHPHPASGFPFVHPPPPPPPSLPVASQGGHDIHHVRLLSHNHTSITSRRPTLHPPPCTSV